MGIIGQSRHPDEIENRNNILTNTLLEIAENAVESLKNEIYSTLTPDSDLPNKTPINFKELHEGIVEHMGEVIYSIHVAPEGEYFFLPDCTAANARFKAENDIIDGEVYYNPSMPIGLVLMPINSKILLAVNSMRLLQDEHKNFGHGIYYLERESAREFNKILLNHSFREVACENKIYLKEFVHKGI